MRTAGLPAGSARSHCALWCPTTQVSHPCTAIAALLRHAHSLAFSIQSSNVTLLDFCCD